MRFLGGAETEQASTDAVTFRRQLFIKPPSFVGGLIKEEPVIMPNHGKDRGAFIVWGRGFAAIQPVNSTCEITRNTGQKMRLCHY
jgi:hypothetical protein